MSRLWSRVGVIGLGLAMAPATLAGSGASRQDPAELAFTTKRPHSATGASLLIDYVNPNDPDAKPFAVDRVVTVFRRGTKIDTSVPAQCDEARASALPSHQCPPGSRVGGGVVHFDQGRGATPPPRILKFKLSLFNASDQVLFRLDGTNNEIRGLVAPAEVRGERRIRSEIPPLPGGSPDNQTAVDFFEARYREISNRRGSYITTPSSCPSRGSWTNHFALLYNDDADPDFDVIQRPRTRSPCTDG